MGYGYSSCYKWNKKVAISDTENVSHVVLERGVELAVAASAGRYMPTAIAVRKAEFQVRVQITFCFQAFFSVYYVTCCSVIFEMNKLNV